MGGNELVCVTICGGGASRLLGGGIDEALDLRASLGSNINESYSFSLISFVVTTFSTVKRRPAFIDGDGQSLLIVTVDADVGAVGGSDGDLLDTLK